MAHHPSDIPVVALEPGSQVAVPVRQVVREVGAACEGVDPNHHLWRNGRLWWVAFTVHRGHRQERIRFSLRTDDVEEARHRRDEVLANYARAVDCNLSIRLRPRERNVRKRALRRKASHGG